MTLRVEHANLMASSSPNGKEDEWVIESRRFNDYDNASLWQDAAQTTPSAHESTTPW